MGARLEDLPPRYQDQARAMLQAEANKLAARPALRPMPYLRAKIADGSMDERDLQSDAERWLMRRGYARQTVEGLEAPSRGGSVRGYFVHIAQCEGNPIMPDLTVYEWPGKRYLHLELKTRNSYRPGQKSAISSGYWTVCFCLADVVREVEEWESDGMAQGLIGRCTCNKTCDCVAKRATGHPARSSEVSA